IWEDRDSRRFVGNRLSKDRIVAHRVGGTGPIGSRRDLRCGSTRRNGQAVRLWLVRRSLQRRACGAQSQDRGRGAHPSAQGDGVQAVKCAEGEDQRTRRTGKGVGRSAPAAAALAFRRRSADSESSPNGGAMILTPRATASAPMEKSPEAYRTIREVADSLDLPQHVLRFWETRFPQIRPLKRAGGRRYYRPDDIERLR